MTLPPLALYLHVPFCVQKCPYCDFYSLPGRTLPWESYTNTVLIELGRWREHLSADPRPLVSLFFGGGTPSLLPPVAMERLLEEIRRLWPLAPECELTMEANPESATLEQLRACRALGFNRLSLGVQALEPKRLAFLRRPHTVEQARQAMDHARRAGFENVSLDLIHGTPGHDWSAWQAELEEALSWNPEHLSCYALTLEEGTPLQAEAQSGRWSLPDEEIQLELLLRTRSWLGERGWAAYEISNFSRPGRECRHNLLYWEYGDFLGLGPAAHGKLTGAEGIVRFSHPADFARYVAEMPGAHWVEAERLTPEEAGMEALLMGLRLERGMALKRYRQVAGEELGKARKTALAGLLEAGLVEVKEGRLRLTAHGWPLANRVLEALA